MKKLIIDSKSNKKPLIRKKFLIFLVVIFIVVFIFLKFTILQPHFLQVNVRDIVQVIDNNVRNILIEQNECVSDQDCIKKEIYLRSVGWDSISIYLYNIKNKKTLELILSQCSNFFTNEERLNYISIYVYNVNHIETVNKIFNRPKPIMEVKFKRNVKD